MSFSVGEILLLDGLAVYPVKAKFAVCICVAPDYFFLVKSENRQIYDCIPLLRKEGRSFPEYDSFIGCKNIFKANGGQVLKRCGFLDRDEISALLEKVRTSRTLARRDIEMIVAALEAALS